MCICCREGNAYSKQIDSLADVPKSPIQDSITSINIWRPMKHNCIAPNATLRDLTAFSDFVTPAHKDAQNPNPPDAGSNCPKSPTMATYRAIVHTGPDKLLSLGTPPNPAAKAGEVVVRVLSTYILPYMRAILTCTRP